MFTCIISYENLECLYIFHSNLIQSNFGRSSNDAKCLFNQASIRCRRQFEDLLNNLNKLDIDYNQDIFRLHFLWL